MPTARRGAAGATYGGKLYVIGGRNAAGNDIATVEAYNPATNTWAARASLRQRAPDLAPSWSAG